jgi:hypothetical protein
VTDTPPTEKSLTPDNSAITSAICKGNISNYGEYARIVKLYIHFLTFYFAHGKKRSLLGVCLWSQVCSIIIWLHNLVIIMLVKIYLTKSSSLTNICGKISRYNGRRSIILGESVSAIVHQRSCRKNNFNKIVLLLNMFHIVMTSWTTS